MMLHLAAALASLLAQGQTSAASTFEERLRRATGPVQLRQLDLWCQKNKLVDERKKVLDLLLKAPPAVKGSNEAGQREAARVAGDQAREVVAEFRAGRAKSVAEEVRKVVGWMSAEKHAPPEAKGRLTTLVQGLLAEEPADRDALLGEINAAVHADRPADELKKVASSFDAQVKSILKKFTTQIFTAVEKCLAAGESGYAFDLYRFLLQVDPDNERAHKSLGEQKIDGRWMRPFEQEQWKGGLAWDAKAGWVPLKQRDRVEKGEVFDLETGKWGKREDLDRLHGEGKSPWRMESEHFELISTAGHELNVQILIRMEAFFLQAFRQYDLFFTGKGGGKAASLVFGVVPTKKKLVVNYYRDEAQFKELAQPGVDWAAGFYSPAKHASYFYSIKGEFHPGVMQHELTHQILGEYSEGGGGGPWLREGAAVFLESAEFHKGTLTLGGLEDNWRTAEYRANLRAGKKEHTLKHLQDTFGPGKDWNQGDISRNYRGAGAAIYFLMHFDGGRHRPDVIQFLRDAYFGSKPRPIEDYIGIPLPGLDLLMDRFYRECELP